MARKSKKRKFKKQHRKKFLKKSFKKRKSNKKASKKQIIRSFTKPTITEFEAMIKSIKINNPGLSQEIESAFRFVDRKFFVKRTPYIDEAVHIAHGQTISQPTTIARMLQKLELRPGLDVLEIGTNTGYHAALVSYLVYPGEVTTCEIFPALVENAIKNINNFVKQIKNKEMKKRFEINIITGDALNNKNPIWNKKYDRIYFTAGISREYFSLLKEMARTLLNDDGLILFPTREFYDYGGLEVWRLKNSSLKLVSNEQGYSFVPIIRQADLEEIYRVVGAPLKK
jgi:protein-L-isoaspartate(D-aspartate) O-methyltransferase